MLPTKRLDDQSYDDILAEAKGRLPWLCPAWTDHNAHDPGITLLELMAWYKEMQQYQMDQLTPEIQKNLLALAGVAPMGERAARCWIELPPDGLSYPRLTELTNSQGMCFELTEEIPAVRPQLVRTQIGQKDQWVDVTEMAERGPAFQPFSFGRWEQSELTMAFSALPETALRLQFHVQTPAGIRRNPPDGETPPPRSLVWEMDGVGVVEPLKDDTWCLSWSGCVTLPVPKSWTAGADGLYRLHLRQTKAGCEEQVRLLGISVSRYMALQQQTQAITERFHIEAAPNQTVQLRNAFVTHAELAVFLRTRQGWEQLADYHMEDVPDGRLVTVDGTKAALDGGQNLMIVCLHREYIHDLLFHAKGRSGERIRLNPGSRKVLTDQLELICLTLCEDGAVRPAPWHYAADLAICGPGDLAFTYDADRESIVFGDGLHGAVVCGGEGAVMVSKLVLSHCGGGNLPAGAGLTIAGHIGRIYNTAAYGGADAESLMQARGRLIQKLSQTSRCISAADYERCVRLTPGLRVAGARALPGYDPKTPHQKRAATVTVVVLPAGEQEYPVADERFLTAVERQLERFRTICIRTKAVPVRYIPISVTVKLTVSAGITQSEIRNCIAQLLSPKEEIIGAAIRAEDLAAVLQKHPGVLRLNHIDLRGLDQNSYRTAAGDLQLPPDALPAMQICRIELQQR